jgi:hypothetical protein
MALTIAGSLLTSRVTVRLSTRRTVTMQVADDEALVVWELLAWFREVLCAPELGRARRLSRAARGRHQPGRGWPGEAPESHGRPPSPIT